MKSATIHGFTIEPTYLSPSTGRTCATVQGVQVYHPRENALGRYKLSRHRAPLGWHYSLGAAREEIERQWQHAYAPEHAFTLCTYQPDYVERLALWWPDAPNPPKALAERAKQDAENSLVEQKRLAEIGAKQRLEAAAPDLLAALKRVRDDLHNSLVGTAAYQRVCAAIDKAEKG